MAAKGVYLKLRSNIKHATLPDNRSMEADKTYLVSLDDFQKLSRSVRETVVEVVGLETSGTVVKKAATSGTQALDLSSFVGTSLASITSAGYAVGQVLQGLNGEAFKLCKNAGTTSVSAGDVLNWTDKTAASVKKGAGEFAGVAVDSTTASTYFWLQTEGLVASAACGTTVLAGSNLKAGTAGKFEVAAGTGDTVATALGAGDSGTAEVLLRSTRARNRYVKRPNIFHSGQ